MYNFIFQVLQPGSGYVAVLECDDSKANVLPEEDHSHTYTCNGDGNSLKYRGDVEDDYVLDGKLTS